MSTVLTAGTAKMGLFALPQFPKLRIMIFVTVFTVVFTVFIIFLNISHLHALLPFEYGKMVRILDVSTLIVLKDLNYQFTISSLYYYLSSFSKPWFTY